MAAKHSPTPWRVGRKAPDIMAEIDGKDGNPVALGINDSDAALIVRAVNAHEALVEALRVTGVRLASKMKDSGFAQEFINEACAEADTALKLAGRGS